MSTTSFGFERCAWCDGIGGRWPGGDCEVCHGKGVVAVSQPPMKCARCWGNGRALNGWAHTFPFCSACAGTGWAKTSLKKKAAGA